MNCDVRCPDWIADGAITIRLTELNPHATAALIETLRDALDADDERVRMLLDLWDALTGDDETPP